MADYPTKGLHPYYDVPLKAYIDGENDIGDSALAAHTGDTSNPHSVTKAQVGLGNVDNTSDASKPVSTAQQAALDLKFTIPIPPNVTGSRVTGAALVSLLTALDALGLITDSTTA